jgi:hypothetical protein
MVWVAVASFVVGMAAGAGLLAYGLLLYERQG